ncbi:MAG TPA: isochorismatase family protein [Streptosporangiaceae bacterium]
MTTAGGLARAPSAEGIPDATSPGYHCVESTMRSAYENGYQVITLTDCTAATSVPEHETAITYDYPMFSKPMTAAEVIAEIG